MTDRSSPTSLVMRKRFGAILKEQRETAGKTQRDVAELLSYDYYTMVSQIERGLGRIPPEDLVVWAAAYRQPLKDFAKSYLYWTDPYVYSALYGINPVDEQALPHVARTATGRAKRV